MNTQTKNTTAKSELLTVTEATHNAETRPWLFHLATLYSVLAHPARVAILSILLEKDATIDVRTLCAALTDTYDISLEQPTISHHLRHMRDAGVIEFRAIGTYHYYQVCNPVQITLLLHMPITSIESYAS